MAKSWTKNGTYATSAIAMFELKALLKAQGWTVPASGDATSLFAGSDGITSGAAGAGGWGNTGAWARLQAPDGVREIVIQRGNNNTTWWIKYSATAKFTGGAQSATVTPTATDTANILGTGSGASAAQLFGGTEGILRYQIMADNSTPYTFYILAYSIGGSVTRGLFFMDGLQTGSYDPLDTDPVVFGAFQDGATQLFTNVSGFPTIMTASAADGATRLSGWLKHGVGGAGFVTLGVVNWSEGSSNVFLPGGSTQNGFTAKSEVFPSYVGRSTVRAAPQGFKGVLQNLKMLGDQKATSADTINAVTTKDHIVLDKVWCLPWDGTDPTN